MSPQLDVEIVIETSNFMLTFLTKATLFSKPQGKKMLKSIVELLPPFSVS
jgi:hypothetical protein